VFGFNFISKILKILNSEETPLQVAIGIALGSIIAFTPFLSLHNLFILLLICTLNVSFRASLLGLVLLSPIGLILEKISLNIGYYLLIGNVSLHPFWVTFNNIPVVPFLKFNNTYTIGSFTLSLILFVPITLLFYFIIKKYRDSWKEKFLKTKLYKILKTSKFVGWITKIYNWIPG